MKRKEEKLPKQAVALKYEPSRQEAPIVTAKGRGWVAEKIIELAKRKHIPITDDPDLVQILSQLELGDQIPSDVYQVVAEIFAFVYHLNRKYQKETHTL